MAAEVFAERTRRETAEKANQAKTEFLANMGHEIRAPLNAIINFTELAPRIGFDAELEEHLATVRTSAQWLIDIANDVVELSRCAAGKVRLKNETFIESALNRLCSWCACRRKWPASWIAIGN